MHQTGGRSSESDCKNLGYVCLSMEGRPPPRRCALHFITLHLTCTTGSTVREAQRRHMCANARSSVVCALRSGLRLLSSVFDVVRGRASVSPSSCLARSTSFAWHGCRASVYSSYGRTDSGTCSPKAALARCQWTCWKPRFVAALLLGCVAC